MAYYKAPDNSLYYIDDDAFADLLPTGSVQVTDAEAEALKPIPPAADRIEELKALLASTDYKVLPDYDQPDPAIVSQRQAWRDEIRRLEAA